MSKNDFFDKNNYKTNSEWKLQLILGWYLSPTIDFDNMIHITFLNRETQNDHPKMMKKDVFDKSGYKKNSNSKIWPILAGYLTPTRYFDNMIHITALMKTLGPKWPHKLPKKWLFLTQNHHITIANWKLWDFMACYLSPTMDVANRIHITAFIKL